MEPSELTIEILKQIRDEMSATRTELRDEIRATREELHATRTELSGRIDTLTTRVESVETTLVELATQQRFVVRHLTTLSRRDRHLEDELDELRTRVDALEVRVGPR